MPGSDRELLHLSSRGRCFIALWMAFGGSAAVVRNACAQEAANVEFDAAFLPGDVASPLDLSRFSHGNPVLPGGYDVDVWMNGEWQARKTVHFEAHAGIADATPCIAFDDLVSYGMSPDASLQEDSVSCEPIGRRVASASTRFDVSEQRLDIEVPQAAMAHHRRGAVSPTQWDPGVTAGTLAWRTNIRHASVSHRRRTSGFLGADAGLNLGAWRLRHAGAWSGGHYRRRHTYAERQVGVWRSQVRMGDIAPADEVFAPVRLRGIGIASDARMSSDGLSGYAPRVRGVADTHATVTMTQNGILLRELVVPPGPFEVDDLYAAGRGGDIDVTIAEADGRVRTFRVPYFPVPEFLREGHTTFAFHAGRVAVEPRRSTILLQGSLRHGFPHDATLYAGWRQWPRQASALVGGAVDTLAGAFALDLTQWLSRTHGNGRLWRFRHGRQWAGGTLVSFRVSRGRDAPMPSTRRRETVRVSASSRVDLLVQRDLGDELGALSVNVGRGWGGRHGEWVLDHGASWTRSWRSATFDVSIRRSSKRGALGARKDTSGQLGFSMPLGTSASSTSLHAGVHGERGGGGVRVGLSGSAGEAAATLYGLTLAKDRADGDRVDASFSRVLPFGEVAGVVDRGATTHAISLSASGGVVIHPGGVTLAQRLGDAAALVKAPGAMGARLATHAGIHVDRRGYAVVPHLMPFRWNSVDLDPAGVSLDVAFSSTHRRVAPTSGALVLVPFETQVATTILVAARRTDGTALPFGAEVADSIGRSVGVVGQAGRIFLRADALADTWTVRWAEGADGQCELNLRESVTTAAGDVRHIGVCE